MARDNTVMLVGRLSKPTVSFIEDYGTFKVAFTMTVLRNNKRIEYPKVVVYGLTETKAREIWSEMKEGKIAIVRGMITTKLRTKRMICPECGCETEFPQLQTEVVAFAPPIILHEDYSPAKFVEISNNVNLLGEVCSQVQTRANCTLYQLAVERRFYVKEQGPETRRDVPWIKSFSDIGKEDSMRLSPGSVVYITGALQTRNVDRLINCNNAGCSGQLSYKETMHEIITSRVEYLHNCDFSENNFDIEE